VKKVNQNLLIQLVPNFARNFQSFVKFHVGQLFLIIIISLGITSLLQQFFNSQLPIINVYDKRQLDVSRDSSAIYEHCQLTVYSQDSSKMKVLATESNTFKRRMREAIEIQLRKPSLNRDNDFKLANIYNTILAPSETLMK